MAKTPGATLYTSNHGSSGRTRCSDLYSGRGSALHHSGFSACGEGRARSGQKEGKRFNAEDTETAEIAEGAEDKEGTPASSSRLGVEVISVWISTVSPDLTRNTGAAFAS